MNKFKFTHLRKTEHDERGERGFSGEERDDGRVELGGLDKEKGFY